MSLPIVILKNEDKWDCHQCGFCCRGSLIPLSKEDLQRLRGQKWDEQPDYLGTAIAVRYREASSGYRLAQRSDGRCVFLGEDGLCRIHSKFGMEAKPTVCQAFPLQLIPHEKQAVLTTRRACPSAAADLGRSTSDQLPMIQKLVREKQLKAESISPPWFKPGERRDWKTINVVLDSARSLLQDQRFPPVRRLVHALQFASLLHDAKTKSLSEGQISDLARTLAEFAPEESKSFFEERRAPKGYSMLLFRLIAVQCARLHPHCNHQPRWSARFQLMKTAWKILRGTGTTPAIDDVFPSTRFEELEKPLGAIPLEIDHPFTRWMESTAESYLYAIADRQNWSVIESLRGLAILFPVGLWLLRWVSHDRKPTVNDMVNIVVALDRSQGYAPMCGSQHRWRLSALGANGELERLAIWFAR